jgi:branched-chain amino acid transport system substrate-binding protein
VTESARRKSGRRSGVILLAVGLFATAACGSQRSHDELVAQAESIAKSESAATGGGPTGDQSSSQGTDDSGAASGESLGTASGASDTTGGGSASGTTGVVATGSGGTTGGTATTVAGVTAKQCTGKEKPIRIGTVGEQSGAIGSFIRTGPQAVQAWAAYVNSKGGINCHKVVYSIADDGGDPARNQSLVRRLVEQDGAIAIVQMDAVIGGAGSIAYLSGRNFPVIGSELGSDWFYEHPNYRPQASTGAMALEAAIAGASVIGKPKGLTKLATFSCIEAGICSGLYNLAPAAAPKYGMDLVFRYQGSLVQPDFTSACQQAKQAGAQVLVVAFDPNAQSRLIRNCHSVGYDPVIATGGPLVNQNLLADPELDGSIIGGTFIPNSVTSNPLVAEFTDVLRRYAPGVSPDAAALTGYISAKMFEAAARKAGDDLTPNGILKGLAALNGEDFGGATMPLNFKYGQNAPKQFCFYVSEIKGGKQVSPDGGKRHCA